MSHPIVFLSHSSKDKKALTAFKTLLDQKTGGAINFFLASDGQSIRLGRNWVHSIEEALNKAELAFVFLSANSIESDWVLFEVGHMYSKGIDVVPVALPGIDLGQIPPPIGLLQGFNMHSAEQMNNVIEKLNEQFEPKHEATFSDSDFCRIFGADSLLPVGFFGEYTPFVTTVVIGGKAKDDFASLGILDGLAIELKKHNIELSIGKRVPENAASGDMGIAPGIRAEVWKDEPLHIVVTLHATMCSLLLPSVANYLQTVLGSTYARIAFSEVVEPCGDDVTLTSRAFGTDLKVTGTAQLEYGGLTIGGRGNYAPLHLEAPKPFSSEVIRQIVRRLFELEILVVVPNRPRLPLDM